MGEDIAQIFTVKDITVESKKIKPSSYLGSYLAGLIEGDGSIRVPNSLRDSNNKLRSPIVKITFVAKDYPLALKLIEVLGGGSISWSKNHTYLDLRIQDLSTLYYVSNLLNGHMRTPKIEALHRMIDWFNNNRPEFIEVIAKDLDYSSLGSNAWLSGFLDCDSNFYCNIKINDSGIVNSFKSYMRLSQRRNYHRENTGFTTSYFSIMSQIASFLAISKVTEINRVRENHTELGYGIRTDKVESRLILMRYLKSYP